MRTTSARIRLAALTAGAAAALLALAACSSGGGAGSGYSAPATPRPRRPSSSLLRVPPREAAILKTGSTTLGTVVVDGKGLTAYVFDKDTANSGTSVCTGACAAQWPAIEATSDHPAVTGVTGTIGTITGVDGKKQVTLDGSAALHLRPGHLRRRCHRPGLRRDLVGRRSGRHEDHVGTSSSSSGGYTK